MSNMSKKDERRYGGAWMSRRQWDDLQGKLRVGQEVRHWSANKGYLAGEFLVDRVSPDRIVVSGRSMQTGSVTISKSDFETVAQVWPQYSTGNFPRQQLREISWRSTYIISLLHWLDDWDRSRRD